MQIDKHDHRQIVSQITKTDILNAIGWDEGILLKALKMKHERNKDAIHKLQQDNEVRESILTRIEQ